MARSSLKNTIFFVGFAFSLCDVQKSTPPRLKLRRLESDIFEAASQRRGKIESMRSGRG